ncbi:MAG: bifunctional oligoribonuclease/PAP phosphatase NrnA [Flavobacteriales bacterium]|nr:bifunctional oligoribonuclease/PAP phosphatase NrnA [Flavobacteriales bacterium]
MKNHNYEALQEELKKRPNILITTHRGPDGDAMGSSLALYQVLKAQGYEVSVVVPNSYPKFLHWLPCNKEVVEFEGNEEKAQALIDDAELIFCLDFNDLSRTDMMSESLQNSTATFVMIDHHQDPSDFANIMFSVPGISSTAQLVYEFNEQMGWNKLLTVDIAQCIYTGLVTDTGSFRFSSVDTRTHEIAAKLIELGLEQADIHQKLFDNNKESRLKLLGYCLSEKLEVLPEYHTAVMSLSQEELDQFNFVKGDTEGFVNYALSIDGVILTAFFVQNENKVKISFRSLNDFRANLLSKKHFKGGGHINAAGGIFEGSLEEAIHKFKTLLPDYKKELIANR